MYTFDKHKCVIVNNRFPDQISKGSADRICAEKEGLSRSTRLDSCQRLDNSLSRTGRSDRIVIILYYNIILYR